VTFVCGMQGYSRGPRPLDRLGDVWLGVIPTWVKTEILGQVAAADCLLAAGG
jgi:hypothetical protein